MTNESIKMLTMFCSNYNHEKIKALKAVSTIKTFRERFLVKENIQYLLFGQFKKGKGMVVTNKGTKENKLKNMKTENLKDYKNKEQELEEVKNQVEDSRYKIQQFRELKSILLNLSYNDNGKKTLNVEIIQDVLDELRRERKTKMVLADADIEEYIDLDLVEAETLDEKD